MPKGQVDCDSQGKSCLEVVIRAALFINCSTGLDHKTEKEGLSIKATYIFPFLFFAIGTRFIHFLSNDLIFKCSLPLY